MKERLQVTIAFSAFILGVYVFYTYVLPFLRDLWAAIKAALELSN